MKRQRPLKSVVLGLAVCTVLAAGAYASKAHYYPVHLPGVDHHGNLSNQYGGSAKLKLVYDTRRYKFCATACGHVKNLSWHHQTYYGRLAVALQQVASQFKIPPSSVVITKDVYKVGCGSWFHDHRASAKAIICGQIHTNPPPPPQYPPSGHDA